MTSHHGNRHGRSEDARRSVLQAADGLLVEMGYAKLTIERIAERAGVAKQTIYRWWPSKTAILMDALVDDATEDLIPPDTGDLGADLRTHTRALAHFLSSSDAGAVFRALTAEAQHDAALATRLRSEYLPRQRGHARLPLDRAVARGELSPGVDIDIAVDELVGPIYYRVLVSGQPVPAEYTDALVVGLLSRLGTMAAG